MGKLNVEIFPSVLAFTAMSLIHFTVIKYTLMKTSSSVIIYYSYYRRRNREGLGRGHSSHNQKVGHHALWAPLILTPVDVNKA